MAEEGSGIVLPRSPDIKKKKMYGVMSLLATAVATFFVAGGARDRVPGRHAMECPQLLRAHCECHRKLSGFRLIVFRLVVLPLPQRLALAYARSQSRQLFLPSLKAQNCDGQVVWRSKLSTQASLFVRQQIVLAGRKSCGSADARFRVQICGEEYLCLILASMRVPRTPLHQCA